ncbi:MFS transporter [Blautia massiliensis]|uniref:MFS transporter n=1 Tax=Blautia TaxID=572511 RepID=UPI00156DA166|nr:MULTISPECIES: MFS transporter [Blautia]MCC2727000.1 MFS transporter [Blautia sp. MSK22_86]NSF58246.1 MFS transporter [Blautia massiliensis (ex Durand et al. 2017)]NSK73664.1 MFS transporter [Blautia massiliensis (ex Durand et al. 2017)]
MIFSKFTNVNASEKITVKERLAYGCGDFSSNIMYSAMAAFLMFYYTDYIGVSAAVVGSIMLFSRIFDGISDLIMGVIIDRTKSPFGKARIWILRLVIPYAIGTVLLFSVPAGWSEMAKYVYIFFSYNIAFTVLFTGINLPYATLTALMTQDQYERSVLSIFRMILATCGTLFIKTCTLPVVKFFGDDARAWTYTFVVFGALEIITFMITFLFTSERVNTSEDKRMSIPISLGFKALVKNKYWFMATLNLVLIFIAQGVNGSSEVYYAKEVLGNGNLVGTFSVALQVTQIVCMFFIAGFVKKFGKRNVLMTGAAIMIVGYGIMGIGAERLPVLIAGCMLRGVGNAGISACMFAMVTDTIEYGEWKTGIRTEGLINSAASFGQKIGNGLSNVVMGAILAAGGYVGTAATQTASAISAIKVSYIYVPIVLTVAQIIVLAFYHLDKEYDAILENIKKRRISK